MLTADQELSWRGVAVCLPWRDDLIGFSEQGQLRDLMGSTAFDVIFEWDAHSQSLGSHASQLTHP